VIDLLIVGAGPAGLSTALLADGAGLTCAVLDRRAPPIDKACGEGLMPGTVAALERLGVPIGGRPFRGIRYRDDDRSAVALFAGRPGLGVRRTALNAALVTAVRDRGIPIGQHTVTAVRQHRDGVTVDDLSARFLVGADGLHSRIRALAGLAGSPVAGRERRWGLRCHVRVAPWTNLVEVYWGHAGEGEAYVTPIAADRVGVALLSGRRTSFSEQLAAFPDLAERLSAAERGTVRGAGPLRQRVSGRCAGRILLVGDAAGYLDALTGEGIGVAIRGAAALVDCVRRGRPDAYEAAWRTASRRYRLLTGPLLAAASRPALRRAIVPVAAQMPRTFRRAVRVLAG